MKKISILLGLALTFITGVLVLVTKQGVRLKERPMVKWSSVGSAAEAGRKIARFYFPLSRQFREINIVGKSDFAALFFQAFQKEAQTHTETAQTFFNAQTESFKGFQMQIFSLTTNFNEGCQNGEQWACIGSKAHKKFLKKQRNPQRLWINMYRLNQTSALLFFKEKISP